MSPRISSRISSHRKRPPADEPSHAIVTWLFAWLLIVAAIAGLIGEVAR
jgi:hypothetical protein